MPNTNNKFSETAKLVGGLAATDDHSAAQVSGIYGSVAGYRRITGFGVCATLATGKKMTVQLKQATDANGSGAKNLGTAVVGAALQKEVMQDALVDDMDRDNGFLFIGVAISSDNGSAHLAGGGVILDNGRFSE